ncbi:ABC transporter ATP-binding protein [Jiangella aurantiaca]|uniref:ABC transporter ATP-binding protein n=1 Tax=Jiangella aurantiaca TaxID=2530373 RepID=A0A4R5AHY1_9ACTN|nr:ABC transporter ATP-binding protein [Jiangella aurantiaca]TDD71070.1 ABC transporter ATP-binding protein [Jiangella aurantiaca]
MRGSSQRERPRPAARVITFGAVVRHGGRWIPVIGLAALVDSLVVLALPFVFGRTVDAIVTGGDVGRWLLVAMGLIVVGIVSDLVDTFADAACVAGTTAWLRNRLIRQVLAIGPAAGRRFTTGDLVSRVSGNAVDAAQAGPSVVTVGAAALPPVGSLALLAYIDVWLAAAFLGGVSLVGLVLLAFTRRTAEAALAYQETQARIAGRLTESLSGIRTIAAAGTVGREEDRVLEPLPDLHDHGARAWRVLARSSAQSAVVGPIVLVAVLAAGGLQVVDGRITAGELFAASQYAVLGAGLGGLTGVFAEFARARAGVARAAEVFAVPPLRYGRMHLPPGPGRLEFCGVTVRGEESPLLDGVDLVVPGGVAVAVVGHSGAGKSVLAALAARLRDPDEGQVLLDGVPLHEVDHDSLRAAVGCAFERPELVGATTGDAIGLGLERDLVEAAAHATHAYEFVSRLPDGFDTPLHDAPMSGGERQRIGLARAWHAGRLLVLDDATSSLDTVTELQISRTLTSDEGRRTRLIVTHRAATAARADLVVWLEQGRVRAFGPHAQLSGDPAYREVFG